jgi:3-oxoacyl-[acyl-carrier-protein] synthase II
MSRRRVVVTGLGAITPLGLNVSAYWEGLIAGRSGVKQISRFDTAGFDVTIGGECSDFQPTDYIDAREIKRLDRFAQLALAAAKEAKQHSGIDVANDDPKRIGVIVGSGIGGLQELEDQHLRLLQKGPTRVSVFTIPRLMVNAASGNISIAFGAKGPNTAVATACASAANAIGDAFKVIQRDEADVMFAGGAESAMTPLGMASFASMKALSTRNDDPEAASRPFDRDRDGFVMGEGAGVVVLEELEHARRRGAEILAELVGYGMTGDACHITQPEEDGDGAARAMKLAIADARIDAESVDYINAHGTSTPLGDVCETRAVREVFGKSASNGRLALSSTKSAIGHLLGASGGVELVAAILAMKNNLIPPTINLDNPDPDCDLNYTPNTAQDRAVEVAMSNSFGFGGHNACLVLSSF